MIPAIFSIIRGTSFPRVSEPPSGGIVHVQSSTLKQVDVAGGVQNFTMNSNFTSGNAAFLTIVTYGSLATSVTINGVTITTPDVTSAYSQGVAAIYSLTGLTGGSNAFSVTLSGSSDYITCACSEFSGIATSSYLDKINSGGTYGSTATISTTESTSTANSLKIAIIMDETGNDNLNITNTSGDSVIWVENNSNAHQGGSAVYSIETSAGIKTSSWNILATTYRTAIATYKAA